MPAITPSLKTDVNFDLKDHTGKTYFEFMQAVKPELDADNAKAFKAPSSAQITQMMANAFDPQVTRKVTAGLNGGMDAVIQKLANQDLKAATLGDTMFSNHLPTVLAPMIAIAAGKATQVKVGDVGRYVEADYAPGASSSLATDVMTGRGYGATQGRRFLDASDAFYLTGLGNYLKNGDVQSLGLSLVSLLTKCDTTAADALAKRSPEAAAVIMDFITVYHAEGDRNLMDPSLRLHSWQKDLFAATMLGFYYVAAGGDAKDFWAQSPAGNGRSGIGETRQARAALATDVCKKYRALSAANEKVASTLENLIGGKKTGNLIQQLADYLNDPKNTAAIHRDADKINAAAAAFLADIAKQAAQIDAGHTLAASSGHGGSGRPGGIHRPTGGGRGHTSPQA